ncbi:hypothetical protein [Kitasatospora phosalacinea]|uniref:hypothetical protein n=1 Tax=Kitasatospora phosalacinea TaxID=2065 RepID=UPI000A587E3E
MRQPPAQAAPTRQPKQVQVRAEPALEYDAWERDALVGADDSAPAPFWRDWYARPAPYRRLSDLRGRVAVYGGTEDRTAPPRHSRRSHLLHRAATAAGLESRLTVHPHLGHLLSPHGVRAAHVRAVRSGLPAFGGRLGGRTAAHRAPVGLSTASRRPGRQFSRRG